MNALWGRRSASCWIVVAYSSVALMVGAAAKAPNGEPEGSLTLAQVLELTLARNPDLAAASYELSAGDARLTQAGLRPNPDLALEFEDVAGTGAVRGTEVLQSTLRLSQVIELGGKRDRRVDVAAFDRSLLDVERQSRELDVLAEATRRFVEVIVAQERLALVADAADLAVRTARAIDLRVKAARSPQAELSRARIGVLRAQTESRQAQSRLSAARRSMVALWGGTEPRFANAQANFYDLPMPASFESLRARLELNPDLTRFATESRLRDAQWRLAQSESRPNLTLGFGVRRYEASNDVGLVAGFSISLPVSDRNQGAIAEAAARRHQSRAEEKATRIRIEATLFGLHQRVVASRDELAMLREEAIPLAQEAQAQTQYGYDRGRFSYLELLSAQQDLLGLRTAVIDLAADVHRLTAELERLTGEPL